MGIVYRITNKLNGKSYVGQTRRSLEIRWKYHVADALRRRTVEQQKPVQHDGKTWLIDAYVKPLSVYVMLDGEFWHGLDKPYDELHSNGKKAYDKDRAQDRWFESAGFKLVRITDKEFLAMKKMGDFSSFVRKLGG